MRQIESFRYNERWTSITSHILLVLMVACAGLGLIRFGAYLLPGWNTTGMLIASVLISAEAVVSLRIFRSLPIYFWNVLVYFLIEWVIIAILIKAFTELRFGIPYFVSDLLNWPSHFMNAFFTIDYMVNMLFTFLIWIITILFARNLADLEGDPYLLRSPDVPVNRRAIHKKIINRFFGIGVLLVLFAGVMRQDRVTIINNPSSSPANISFLFYYFLLGLVLLSLTNFASLRATWSLEHATIQKNLAARWIFSSILFLSALLIFSIILPTHYSIGFLDALAYVFNFGLFVIRIIIAVLTMVFSFILHILGALFNFLIGQPQVNTTSSQNQLQKVIQNGSQQMRSQSFWDVIRSLIFWIVLAVILIYAFSQYLQRNREFIRKLGKMKFLKWMTIVFQWLRNFWNHSEQNIREALRSGMQQLRLQRARRRSRRKWNFINLRRLTPRQQILFYYHAFLRRADETGMPRSPWMTPYEYSETLEKEISEQEENISAMTDGFIEARYSEHPVEEDLVGRIKSSWNHLRSFFRSRRPLAK